MDARYLSQPWELTIPLDRDRFESPENVERLVEHFNQTHERMRGSREEGRHLFLSNWRVKAVGRRTNRILSRAGQGGNIPRATLWSTDVLPFLRNWAE